MDYIKYISPIYESNKTKAESLQLGHLLRSPFFVQKDPTTKIGVRFGQKSYWYHQMQSSFVVLRHAMSHDVAILWINQKFAVVLVVGGGV